MSGQLDLVKKVELILEKKGFKKIEAKVCLCLDESGSISTLFSDGTLSRAVDRALAIGYKFDDDGEIDVWSFAGPNRFCKRSPATQDQYGSYLKHRMLGGSTIYHEVLEAIAKDYFAEKKTVVSKASVISKLFGGKDKVEVEAGTDLPAFVTFITDGMPDSSSQALTEVQRVLSEYPNMFVQFIGIGHQNYGVLRCIAAACRNAAFATIEPHDSDEEVLDKFLNEKARAVLER